MSRVILILFLLFSSERSAPGPAAGRVFPPELVVAVKAIACELPARLGLPLARLHVPDIRADVIRRGLVASLSGTTIWRWLSEDALKPWIHRSWIFPRDPTSSRRRRASSTSTPASGTVSRSGATSSSSAPTRR
jgi:hypothetical protein